MFLRKMGVTNRFAYDVIYSCLQKSLRRGDYDLALEMALEFGDNMKLLKARLMQHCCEDCPDLDLIKSLHYAKLTPEHIMPYVKAICDHVKCRDGCYAMRIACEMEPIREEPILTGPNKDDLLSLTRKCLYYVHNGKQIEFINLFQPLYGSINTKLTDHTYAVNNVDVNNVDKHANVNHRKVTYHTDCKLTSLYVAVKRHITFLYTLCVWNCVDYIHEPFELSEYVPDVNRQIDMEMTLPNYVYDKHTRNCPNEQRTYKFFIDNCIINPRHSMEESDIEIHGKKLYVETNKGVGDILSSICNMGNDYEIIDPSNIKLLQTQLRTSLHKPSVYYCSTNGRTYDMILKGPYKSDTSTQPQILSDNIKNKLLTEKVYDSSVVIMNKQPYIMSFNLIKITDPENTVVKSSKIESNVTLYNGDHHILLDSDLYKLTNDEWLNLFEILAYRKIIGTNDTNNRNIVYYDHKLYSIDDPVLRDETNYMFKVQLSSNIARLYESKLNELISSIKEMLTNWDKLIYYSEDIPVDVRIFMRLRLSELMRRSNWKF